jgi:AcrR family transcriptional regulator
MPAPRRDRRIERSKQALRDAMVALIMEQGFEAITVAAIAERANVGRSTFYSHFADKEDLLLDGIERLGEFLSAAIAERLAGGATCHPALAFSLPMIEHADERRDLFKALVGKRSGAMVQERMHEMIAGLVRAPLEKAGADLMCRHDVVAEYVTGAFFAILDWWLTRPSAHSAAAVDEMFCALVVPGLEARAAG